MSYYYTILPCRFLAASWVLYDRTEHSQGVFSCLLIFVDLLHSEEYTLKRGKARKMLLLFLSFFMQKLLSTLNKKRNSWIKNYHWLSQGCQMRKNHCQLSCSKRMIKSVIVDDSWVSNSHDVIKSWCFPLTTEPWYDMYSNNSKNERPNLI